jgi:uncharacterized membrane protein
MVHLDVPSIADALPIVALAIALAACAGLRAWLPLLLAGTLSRLGLLTLGSSFAFLGSNKALLLFGIATVVELIGDKIPAVDHALDLIGTPLRPAAGALLAASVLGQISDPLTALALGTALGAPAALVPHAAKAAVRTASTALTAGIANPFLSFLEDGLTLVLFLVAVVLPILVVALLLTVTFLIVKRARQPRTAARPA